MKGAIVGACVALAVIGVELATGIEMSLGVRMMIIVPLCVIAGIMVAEK
jgi:hypothetical protein